MYSEHPSTADNHCWQHPRVAVFTFFWVHFFELKKNVNMQSHSSPFFLISHLLRKAHTASPSSHSQRAFSQGWLSVGSACDAALVLHHADAAASKTCFQMGFSQSPPYSNYDCFHAVGRHAPWESSRKMVGQLLGCTSLMGWCNGWSILLVCHFNLFGIVWNKDGLESMEQWCKDVSQATLGTIICTSGPGKTHFSKSAYYLHLF